MASSPLVQGGDAPPAVLQPPDNPDITDNNAQHAPRPSTMNETNMNNASHGSRPLITNETAMNEDLPTEEFPELSDAIQGRAGKRLKATPRVEAENSNSAATMGNPPVLQNSTNTFGTTAKQGNPPGTFIRPRLNDWKGTVTGNNLVIPIIEDSDESKIKRTMGEEEFYEMEDLIEDDDEEGINDSIPTVIRTRDEIREGVRLWRNTVVIRLLGREVGFSYLSSKLRQIWTPQGHFELVDVGHGYYMVKFEHREDFDFALSGGPWMTLDHYLIVREWTPTFNAISNTITTTTAWVRITNVGMQNYTARILRKIGDKLGRTVRIDPMTKGRLRGNYARLAIELDLKKPLEPEVRIGTDVCKVEYEGLHLICFECGKFGHRKENCPPNTSSNMEEDISVNKGKEIVVEGIVEVPVNKEKYGEWMTVRRGNRGQGRGSSNASTKSQFQSGLGTRFEALRMEEDVQEMRQQVKSVLSRGQSSGTKINNNKGKSVSWANVNNKKGGNARGHSVVASPNFEQRRVLVDEIEVQEVDFTEVNQGGHLGKKKTDKKGAKEGRNGGAKEGNTVNVGQVIVGLGETVVEGSSAGTFVQNTLVGAAVNKAAAGVAVEGPSAVNEDGLVEINVVEKKTLGRDYLAINTNLEPFTVDSETPKAAPSILTANGLAQISPIGEASSSSLIAMPPDPIWDRIEDNEEEDSMWIESQVNETLETSSQQHEPCGENGEEDTVMDSRA